MVEGLGVWSTRSHRVPQANELAEALYGPEPVAWRRNTWGLRPGDHRSAAASPWKTGGVAAVGLRRVAADPGERR